MSLLKAPSVEKLFVMLKLSLKAYFVIIITQLLEYFHFQIVAHTSRIRNEKHLHFHFS